MAAMNFKRFINKISSARMASPLREASEIILACPGMKSLCVGLPNPATFPVLSMHMEDRKKTPIQFVGEDLCSSFQYTITKGYPTMLDWVRKLNLKYQKPPALIGGNGYAWDSIITTGCEDGLCKIVDMLVEPGDHILVQNPAYPGIVSKLKPLTNNIIPVESDREGVIPSSLLTRLNKWKPSDSKDANSTIPKWLYTVPNSSNPTGSTATLGRKREIYEIAQEYDLLIVEDDAYFYLQFGETPPSYQSLDTDGRVLRLDTMSKVLGGGLRLGWVSGADVFIERILFHQQVSTLQASSLSQMVAIKLFEEWEPYGGFEQHLSYIKKIYEAQRDLLISCAEKHLAGLATWNVPEGGMFLWLKVQGIEDTTNLIYTRAKNKNILVMPGSAFEITPGAKSPYLRLSYSFETEENMNEIMSKLAECIREEMEEQK